MSWIETGQFVEQAPPERDGAEKRRFRYGSDRFAYRNVMERWSGLDRPQSALMLANFTTFAHFSVSSAMSLRKSAGEPASVELPKSASRALILGSARLAFIASLSLSTICDGVFLGAPTPYQALAS